MSTDQIAALTYPEDLPHAREVIQQPAGETIAAPSVEVRILRKDGTTGWVQIFNTLIDYEGLPAVLSTSIDITVRKHAEETLLEKDQLLVEAQSIGHIGSWSYDIANDKLKFSDEMYRLLDITRESFSHNRAGFLNLIYRTDSTEVEKWIESIRAGQRLQELDFRIFYKSGELRHMHVKGALVFDQGAPIRFTGTMQDITERKLAEIQIQQQLEHLNALRRIDQAITSSFNMHATLDVVITQVVKQLQVDVTDILLLTQDGNSLRYAAGSGFRSSDIKSTLVHLNKSYAGQAIKSRQIVQIENIHARPNNPGIAPSAESTARSAVPSCCCSGGLHIKHKRGSVEG
jgi:PAS domain-containing protein